MIVNQKLGVSSVIINVIYTFNCIQCTLSILRVQIPYRLAHDQTELDLVVHGNATRTKDGAGTRKQDGRRGLKEEKRLLGGLVVELLNVIAGREVSHLGPHKSY